MKSSRFISLLLSAVLLVTALAFQVEPGAVDFSGLSTSQKYFLRTIGSLARADYYENDILASVTLSQAIYESGWGTSSLATGGKNLFGIKAFSNWTGKVYDQGTSMKYSSYDEYMFCVGQSRYNEITPWRAYDTWTESVENHSNVLLQYDGVAGASSYSVAYQKMVDGGYCSDSGYADTGCSIIEAYGLTDYDSISLDSDGIAAITSDDDLITLDSGNTYNLSLTTYPANKTPSSITWKSDNTSVATVDSNGKITAVGRGMTLVSATLKNGREACCIVYVDCNATVMNESVYVFSDADTSSSNYGQITKGSAVTIIDPIIYQDILGNKYYRIEGYNTSGTLVSGYAKYNCIFNRERTVSDIVVPKDEITVKLGSSYTVSAAVYPCDAVDTTLTWSSSNTEIATVTNNGAITGKAIGTAVITASASNGVQKEITVNIAAVAKTYVGILSDGPVAVRSKASLTSGSRLGQVAMYKEITVNGEADGYWYNVTATTTGGSTVTGYMHSTYVRIVPDGFTVAYRTLTNDIAVHSGMSLSTAKCGDIASGEEVAIISKNGDWSHVIGNSVKGYAIHGYAAIDGITTDGESVEGFFGRVISSYSTVREGPTKTTDALGRIPQGAQITIIGGPISAETYTWYKISGQNADGVTLTGYADSGYAQGKRFYVYLYKGVVNVDDYLNVRASASTSASVIGKLYNDEVVTVLGEAVDGWYNVEYTDSDGDYITGYCSADYIGLAGKISAGLFDTDGDDGGSDTDVAEGGFKGRVISSYSTVRVGPTKTTEALGRIPQNGDIIIIGNPISAETYTWYNISGKNADGVTLTGYADSGYAQNKRFYVFLYTANVTVDDKLNVRDAPSTSTGNIIDRIANGKEIILLGEAVDGWYSVEYTNSSGTTISGYCSADYITGAEKIPVTLVKEEPFGIIDSSISITDGIVYGVYEGMTVSELLVCLSGNVSIVDSEGAVLSDESVIGTNDMIRVVENDVMTDYKIFVKGDINGDGKIAAADYLLLKRNVLGQYDFDELQFKAARIRDSSSTSLSAADYLILKRVCLGLYTIEY